MGLLDFLFGKPIKLDNEFFGTMLFIKDKKDPIKSYFECKKHFAPTGKIIEIVIDGNESGPTQKQIEFFKNIEENFEELSKVIVPLIEDEFGNWKKGFKIANFQKEFEPVYLRLPRCETQPIKWEIAFESEHDRNHVFTITMSDFNAKEILIDG